MSFRISIVFLSCRRLFLVDGFTLALDICILQCLVSFASLTRASLQCGTSSLLVRLFEVEIKYFLQEKRKVNGSLSCVSMLLMEFYSTQQKCRSFYMLATSKQYNTYLRLKNI